MKDGPLDRSYFLDLWISDESLVTILNNNYDLDCINKYYVNKYIHVVYLEYKRFDYFIHDLKNGNHIIINKTSFYYLTKTSSAPNYFSTK